MNVGGLIQGLREQTLDWVYIEHIDHVLLRRVLSARPTQGKLNACIRRTGDGGRSGG